MRIAAAIVLILIAALGIWIYVGHRRMDRERANTGRLAAACESIGNESNFEKERNSANYRNPRYDQLTAAYPRIRDGMGISAVQKLLGRPTYAQALVDKDGVGWSGCDWIYVLERTGNDESVPMNEDVISVLFGKDSNVSGHFWKTHPGE